MKDVSSAASAKMKLSDLKKRRAQVKRKIDSVKKQLGHPHLDFMSAHDLAESEFNLYSSLLEEIELEIRKLEREVEAK